MTCIYFKKTDLPKFNVIRNTFVEEKRKTDKDYQEPILGTQLQDITVSDQSSIPLRTTNSASVISNTTYTLVPAVSDELLSHLIDLKFSFSTEAPKTGNL